MRRRSELSWLRRGRWIPLLGIPAVASAAYPTGLSVVTLNDSPPESPCTTGGCTYDPLNYATSNYNAARFVGAENFADVGTSMAVGDFDGDGFQDIAVGAPRADVNGLLNRGAVFIWYGSASGWTGNLSMSSAITLAGRRQDANLGASIVAADLNGDGRTDLVIGSPGYEGTNEEGGKIYVVPGSAQRLTSQTTGYGIEGLSSYTAIWGAGATGAQLGFSMSMGDVGYPGNCGGVTPPATCLTGDGVPDLLIGAPGLSHVWLVYGSLTSNLNLASPGQKPVFKFSGAAGERAGAAVAVVASLDGNSGDSTEADILIGAPSANNNQGRLYLVQGRSKDAFTSVFPTGDLTSLSLPAGVKRVTGDLTFAGNPTGEFGFAMAGVRDFNGDGLADAAVGAPSAGKPGDAAIQSGRVYMLFGAASIFNSGSVLLSQAGYPYLYGASNYDTIGYSLSAGGNLDNPSSSDPYADFLIGGRRLDPAGTGDYGGVYAVPGRSKAEWSFGALAVDGVRFMGSHSTDYAGTAVLGGFNLDGDGYSDFLISAPGSTIGSFDQGGRVYLINFGDYVNRDADSQSRAQGDCNDFDVAVYYRTDSETCDGKDNDCDGKIDVADPGYTGAIYYADADNDSFGDPSGTPSCASSQGVANSSDCDDTNADVFPGADELCNAIDDDCDGRVDDDDDDTLNLPTWYMDMDADGFGDPDSSVMACVAPELYISDFLDCDDMDSLVNPNADEVCNSIDDDCDTLTDDADPSISGQTTYYLDSDGDGYGLESQTMLSCGSAPMGYVLFAGDCNDGTGDIGPVAVEQCDTVDNDCDGLVDDGDSSVQGLSTWYEDSDGDRYGREDSTSVACAAPAGYVGAGQDCNDQDAAINPGATEACDTLDNDCDSLIDDSDSNVSGQGTWYADSDGDLYGDLNAPRTACTQPEGVVNDATDCNDQDGNINPAAEEVCDGADNNCDLLTDGEDPTAAGGTLWYIDGDGDGYGTEETIEACSQPEGAAANGGDCDDFNATINPGAPEWPIVEGEPQVDPTLSCYVADDIDNDCDAAVDEGTCRSDDDDDGSSEENGDCNDAEVAVGPGMPEVCNGVDDDCNGLSDDGYDVDGDGQLSAALCTGEVVGTDCDDAQASIYSGAAAACDGADSDCDGVYPDSGFSSENDEDGDGHRICADDCDDQDAEIFVGAIELCDGKDNNCNGTVDLDGQVDSDGDGQTGCEGDCNDTDAAVYQGAAEVCDGKDNDCDYKVPDNESDSDGDLHLACADDCNDLNAQTYTGAAEVCDGEDNDCDQVVPAGELDGDSDGYAACEGDCDDSNASLNPDASDVCDGVDNDCNGTADDSGAGTQTFYQDSDGDGQGNPSSTTTGCGEPPAGFVEGDGDCDDQDASIFAGAPNQCDGLDHNCDGAADYLVADFDADDDGVLDSERCATLTAVGPLDCDDSRSDVNPAAPEQCDSVDHDCDGQPGNEESDCEPGPSATPSVDTNPSCSCTTEPGDAPVPLAWLGLLLPLVAMAARSRRR